MSPCTDYYKIVKIEKKNLYTAFIDFRKAYDCINSTLLFLKLQSIGIKGLFYENIKHLHESTSYMIKVKGGYLAPITCHLGLLQGGILSPILFNLYIDDIKYIFGKVCDPINLLNEQISHLLYADDLIIFSKTENGLKQSLRYLEEYCKLWQLDINVKKSKIMIFNSSGKKLKSDRYLLQGHTLEITDSYCYLGIDFTPSGSFRHTQKNLREKAQKAMFPLYSVISQFNISISHSLNLFQTFVNPALYNAENWATLSEHKIESIHNKKSTLTSYLVDSEPDKILKKFLKFLIGVNKSTSTLAILGETGNFPLFLQGFLSLLKFWHRISNINTNSLVSKALQEQMNGAKQSEWLRTIHFLLKYLGMERFLQQVKEISYTKFQDECKKKLREKFINEWNDLRKSNTKLETYEQIKEKFEREPYLENVTDFQLRKIVAKFRCSDHKLEIEIGRHNKIPRESRVCRTCPNRIEDEMHFLCYCPSYNTVRAYYFGTTTLTNETGKSILKCKEKEVSLKLANYLQKAYLIRETLAS